MAAALRGFGDAKEEKKDAWDALDDADNEEEEGPLDARRLLLAARRARHEAAARYLHSHQNDSEYDASLIPPSKTFAKASRKATALGALACLMNELYVPLTRPVYDALYEHLANGGRRPDVIVADVATLGARDAADVFDIPLVINAPSLLYGRAGGAPGAALSTGSSRSEKAQAALAPKLLALASSSALMTSNHVRRAVGLRIHSGPDELVPPALLRRPASGTDFPCAARASLPTPSLVRARCFGRRVERAQKANLAAKDERIKTVTEALHAMRTLKVLGMEPITTYYLRLKTYYILHKT